MEVAMKRSYYFLVFLLLLGLAGSAFSQGITEPFLFTTAEGNQDDFEIAYNENDDQYLVVWCDYTLSDIYGRILDWEGNPVVESFPICSANSMQRYPHLDYDPVNNMFLVAFVDYRDSHPGMISGVFVGADGSIVDVAGSLEDGSFPICSADGNVWGPSVGYNSMDQNFLVVWTDSRNADDPSAWLGGDVFGQIVATDGTLTPESPDTNLPIATNMYFEEAVTGIDYVVELNEWLVVFASYFDDTQTGQVTAQRVKNDGSLLNPDGTEVVTKSTGSNTLNGKFYVSRHLSNQCFCINPELAIALAYGIGKSNGAIAEGMVAWKGIYGEAMDNDVYCQRIGYFADGANVVLKHVDGNGDVLDEPNHTCISFAPDWAEPVDVAHNARDNEYLVVWGDPRTNGWIGQDMYCQRLWINDMNEMVMLADDRINTVDNTENILLAGNPHYEGAHNSVAYNYARNEYMVVYKVGPTGSLSKPRGVEGDGQGNRVKGPVPEPSPVDDGRGSRVPSSAALLQNYPNPFNAETMIPFHLDKRSHVRLTIFDLHGRRVAQIMEGVYDSGEYRARWNSEGLATGVYLYRLELDGFQAVRKMMLVE